MAEQVDQLPTALTAIEKDLLEKSRGRRQAQSSESSELIYPLVVLTIAFFLMMGLMVLVVPKFRDIFADMDITLPQPTQLLMEVYDASYGWIIAVLILLFLVLDPLAVYIRLRPRRPEQHRWTTRIGDFIKWRLPVFHWFEKNYALTQVVESLRLSLGAGCPVDRAIGYTLDLDVNLRFRKRLRKWYDHVVQGQDVSRAAEKSGMSGPLVWAFDHRVNSGNTPAILAILEDFYRHNYSYMVALTRNVSWPCITVLLGTAVGYVVYSFFLPMVELIQQTSNTVMP
jgi:type IV pilus assembly protein PilC